VSLIISVWSISVITAVPVARAVVSAGGEEKADSILELYPEPFFPEGTYDSSIPDPESFLGYPLSTKPIHHRQAIDYLQALASFSRRVELHQYGETFEGRGLYYLVISSEENMNRLGEIKSSLELLADPRRLGRESELTSLINETPAVAWLTYTVHGDELSGTDAAIQVAYQLVAHSWNRTRESCRMTIPRAFSTEVSGPGDAVITIFSISIGIGVSWFSPRLRGK